MSSAAQRRCNSLNSYQLRLVLSLRTLGELRLVGPAGDLLAGRRKELVLLTCLAQRSPRGVRRAELMDLLWGEREEKRARHSLRQALLALRRVVGDGLSIEPEKVALASGTVELDLAAFDAEIAAGRLRDAVERWGGDFLLAHDDVGGEAYRVWVEAERQRSRRRLADALEGLVAAAHAAGDSAAAIAWSERWSELLPFDERAYHHLVETLDLDGHTDTARARHAEYVQRARRELGLEPSLAFLRLGERLSEAPAPRAVYRTAGSAALFSPDLVGREAARAELRSAWRDVADGGSAAIVVEGGEGTGKTRLCDEFVRSLEEERDPPLVLRARAKEELREAAWSAACELLARLSAAPGLGGAADEDLAELGRLLPAIRERWPRLPGSRGDDHALHRATAQVLAAVGHEMPVIVFVDDSACADPQSGELIEALARQLPPRVLLLVTALTDGAVNAAKAPQLGEVPGVRRLRLPPLTLAEIDTLLGSMLEIPAGERRPLAARLHAETGGNPFFAREIVSAMVDEGHLAPDARGVWRPDPAIAASPLPFPSGVRDAIARRLDRLGEAAKRVAACAAALEEPIDRARLAEDSALPATTFQAALDELIARRLLKYRPAPTGTLEFAHPLMRRAAVERLRPHRALVEPSRRAVRRRIPAAAALVLTVLVLGAVLLRRSAAPASIPTIAIGQIESPDGADASGLAAPLADMLATNLARVRGLPVVSSARMYEIVGQLGSTGVVGVPFVDAARRAGADEVIEGRLDRASDGRLRVVLRRLDLRTGARRGEYSAEGGDVFELADRATASLADAFGVSASDLRIADATTRSLAAYRDYADGLRSLGAADYERALRLFDAALAEDTAFAMAALFARNAGTALGGVAPSPSLERLDSLSVRAPDRERLLIRTTVASVLNEPVAAVLAESLAVRFPNEPDGHMLLGAARLHEGDFLGALPPLARVIAMDSLGLRVSRPRCWACDAFVLTASAYTLLDSLDAAERVTRKWIRLQPGAREAWRWLAVTLAAQRRFEEAAAALRTAAAASRPDLPAIALFFPTIVSIRAGDYAVADSVLRGIVRDGPTELQGSALWWLTISLRNQGRLREALAAAREHARRVPPGENGPALHTAQILFESARFREAAELLDSLAAFPPMSAVRGGHARHKSWTLMHLAATHAAAGDTTALAALLEPLRSWGTRSAYGRDRRLHHHANALLLVARGQLDDAAAEFRRAIYSTTLGYTRTNYELARTLLALRRPHDAVAILRPALRGTLDASNLYVTHTDLHERLGDAYAAAGEPDSAAVHYRIVLAAWRNADPELRARREAVRARLAAIAPKNEPVGSQK